MSREIYETVMETVMQALDAMDRKFQEPAGIVFNRDGWIQAMHNNYGNGFNTNPNPEPTYCGLPYRIDSKQTELVKVLDKDAVSGAVRFTVPISVAPTDTKVDAEYVLIARALTKSQLCDIVNAWCKENKTDPLANAFFHAVEQHGCFE